MESATTDDILQYFNNVSLEKNAKLEIELRGFIEPTKSTIPFIKCAYSDTAQARNALKDVVKKFKDPQIENTINFLEDKDKDKILTLIKQSTYNNKQRTVKHYYKKNITQVYLNYANISFKLSGAIEYETTDNLTDVKIGRSKIRISNNINDYRLDITLIKKYDRINPQTVEDIKSHIEKYYNMKLNELLQLDWMIFDLVEFELEYIGTAKLVSAETIKSTLDLILKDYLPGLNSPSSSNSKTEFNQVLYEAAKILKSDDPRFLKNLMNKLSTKTLLKQVIELDKSNFYNTVLPNINEYLVGHKYDGLRTLLRYKDNVLNAINKELIKIECDSKIDSFMLDSEFIGNTYYIFDVLEIEGKSIINLPFAVRQSKIKQIIDSCQITSEITLQLKEFTSCSKIKNYKEYLESSKLPNDGLIFNENKSYYEMQVFKWKPVDKMTLDFVIRKCPDVLLNKAHFTPKNSKNTLYLLFSGIQVDVMFKLKLTKIMNYNDIFPNMYQKDYIPIQFCPSSNPLVYLYESKDTTLDNKIGEFLYNTVKSEWILQHLRVDREIDYANGTYYGNNFQIAEQTFNNILNPLKITEIDNPNKLGYFAESDNSLYKAQRNYNSMVKEYLISIITDDNYKTVVDLACGKGQDLFRYRRACVKFLLAIDADIDALNELNKRKYNFTDMKNAPKCPEHMAIYTLYADLNQPCAETLETIKSHNIPIPLEGVDVVICNLAIHYMCGSKDNIKNFIKLVSSLLSNKSRFLFTCFDGSKVYDLLKENDGHYITRSNDVVKYSIKQKYTGVFDKFGQKIDVLLPFSQGDYYTEYLVNIKYLAEVCEKEDLHLEIYDDFMSYESKVPKEVVVNLTKLDKEYIKLYTAVSFSRNKNARVNTHRKTKKRDT